jgi:hypothetical protein
MAATQATVRLNPAPEFGAVAMLGAVKFALICVREFSETKRYHRDQTRAGIFRHYDDYSWVSCFRKE